ncbi:MAG: hypothetical protein ACREUW_12915 [Burkholderiales bacterium]
MNRILSTVLITGVLAFAGGAAAQGLPGATVKPEGAARPATPADREQLRAQMKERCAADPQKCEAMKKEFEARREQCKADPEKCRAEIKARLDEHYKKADANGDGALSRAEAEKGMPRLAKHFDDLDANKDGVVTREELAAAMQKRHGEGGKRGPAAPPAKQG